MCMEGVKWDIWQWTNLKLTFTYFFGSATKHNILYHLIKLINGYVRKSWFARYLLTLPVCCLRSEQVDHSWIGEFLSVASCG